jgi:hypothetical protein
MGLNRLPDFAACVIITAGDKDAMFEQEKAFYAAHQTEFREKYLNKWLVISGDSLYGVYDTAKQAGISAMERFYPGNFMLHRPADDGKVLVIGPTIKTHCIDGRHPSKPKRVIQVSKGNTVGFGYV